MSVGSFAILEGNITGRKKTKSKTHRYAPNHNDKQRQRSGMDAWVGHQRVGAGQGGLGCTLVLSVSTEPECPEDNLRVLMGDSNPNHGITRQKKKKTFPAEASNIAR